MDFAKESFGVWTFLILGQSFKSIGSIEQSSEPQNVPTLCCAQNMIETYIFSIKFIISGLEQRNFIKLS